MPWLSTANSSLLYPQSAEPWILVYGVNTFSLRVTASNEVAHSTYELTVIRPYPSENSSMYGLTVTPYDVLTPAEVDPEVATYYGVCGRNETDIGVNAWGHPLASTTVTGCFPIHSLQNIYGHDTNKFNNPNILYRCHFFELRLQ